MNFCLRWREDRPPLSAAGRNPANAFFARARKRSSVALKVFARGRRGAQQQLSQKVPASRPPLPLANQPIYIKLGALFLAVVAAFQLVKRLRSKGSMDSLESRGLLTEGEQTTRSSDPFYNRMMRNVNTVQYEELTQAQIEAARKRRSQDRRNNDKVDLSKIQLPANHPFAVSKELSEEEEQLQMARLNVRRGMPLKDLTELKNKQQGRQVQFERDAPGRMGGSGNRDGRIQ